MRKGGLSNIAVICIVLGIILVVGGFSFYARYTLSPKVKPPLSCTQEAKQCPDGSYVGRVGPNCEFAECPSVTSIVPKNSGVLEGNVAIGPICPVEQIGHPCNPTPAMYASHPIFIYLSDKKTLIKTLTPNASGDFYTTLLVGNYFIDAQHQSVGSIQGVPAVISIKSGGTTTLTISIDTGIR